MKTVCERDMCTACGACIQICPKNALRIEDSMFANNAIIDEEKCVECNTCYKVCQVCNPLELKKPVYWKEGWSKDSEIRAYASSGGAAGAIERAFINEGGVVCSCVFDKGEFVFQIVDSEKEVRKFVGSKYVKSNPGEIYKKVRLLLRQGEKVLFVGLPCQVAAVKKYVGKEELLFTIDLICHGTPSPKVLDKFLKDNTCNLAQTKDISFRQKTRFGLEADQKKFTAPNVRDHYMFAFLNSIVYTENCYSCRYARIERISDLTLGDSWGSTLEEEEKKKGVSLILCQTEKGKTLLDQSDLYLKDVDLQRAIENNHQLSHASAKPEQREKFLRLLKEGKKYSKAVLLCYPERYMKDMIKTLLYRMKNGK